MMGQRCSVLVLGAAILGLGVSGERKTRADVVSLGDLIATGGSVQVGNEVFDQFSYSGTGQMPTAANILVSGISDSGGNPGLRFMGGITDAYDPSGPQQASTGVVTYRVTSLADPISLARLSGDPIVTGPGDGALSVTETFASGTSTYQGSIYAVTNNGQNATKLTDTIPFAPVSSIATVNTGISALNMGGFLIMPYVDQTFGTATAVSATATTVADPPATVTAAADPPPVPVIPEPSAMTLLGLGVIGLLGSHWQRRRSGGLPS